MSFPKDSVQLWRKPVGFRARGGYGAQARGSREQDRERGPLRQALRALQQDVYKRQTHVTIVLAGPSLQKFTVRN